VKTILNKPGWHVNHWLKGLIVIARETLLVPQVQNGENVQSLEIALGDLISTLIGSHISQQ